MAENNNEQKGPTKRRRPTLYKKDEKDEDVLKKLQEVRQNLQDSLKDDKGPIEQPPAAGPIKKEPLSTTPTSGQRRLFKKEDLTAPEKGQKAKKAIKKPVKQVSAKRMARVNARVKSRMEELKTLSKKKKALIIVWVVVMTVPFFFLSTLTVVGLEFDFTGFGLNYNENKPGTVMLSFPARNPSFLPAQLGIFTLDLYSEDGKFIGKAYNNDMLYINPYETKILYVTLAFNEQEGGKWWSDWLSDLVLSLNIGTLTYNGLAIDASAIPPINLDTGPIIRDMITGLLDLEELIGGLDLGGMLPTAPEGSSSSQLSSADSQAIWIDPYSHARMNNLIERVTDPKAAQFDDVSANLSFAMSETEDKFSAGISAIIGLGDLVSTEDLGGITLGPIKMQNLDVEIVVNTEYQYEDTQAIQDDENWYTHYNTPIAKLISTRINEIYIADPKNRDSILRMNMSILKDDIPDEGWTSKKGQKLHPSAFIDWDAPADAENSINNFLAGTGLFEEFGPAWKQFPSWYFLYNLLTLGGLDCGIKINNVDINIFGLNMTDLSIPMDVLPPIVLSEGTLDPDAFLSVAPDYGIVGIAKNMRKAFTEAPALAFLGIPSPSQLKEASLKTSAREETPQGIPPEKDLNEFLDDFIGMIEFPSISLDDIEETWGSNASLHIGLPITLNNSMLNFYAGFEGMKISIASTSYTSDQFQPVLSLTLKGSGTDTVYLPGINSIVPVEISLDILKNETVAPHAQKFLTTLIEQWTLDALITAEFDKLVLFKENYTYGHFDIAIPLYLGLEDILVGLVADMIPGLIEGLVGGGLSAPASAKPKVTPINLMYLMSSPLPGLLSLAGKSKDLLALAENPQLAQDEGGDPISDLINGLINDLVGGLLGDALGSEMEFNLGFNVTVSEGHWTKMTIHIGDFYVDDFFITIGLGDTDLRLQSKNRYGEWEDIIGIQVDQYFEIKEKKREDIIVSINIYETNALCTFINDFIDEFFDPELTNTVDLKIAGTTTLNLSGIFLPDLSMALAFEDLDLGLKGTEIIDDLFGLIYDLQLDAPTKAPQLLDLWAGPLSRVPFLSQSIDLESIIHIGEISIDGISEGNFSNKNAGYGEIALTIGSDSDPTVSYLMSLDIGYCGITIYDHHPVDEKAYATKLIEILIDDGVGLDYASNRKIQVLIRIYKSTACETFINNLISSGLKLDGWLNISASIRVFGCNIEIKPTFLPAINLTRLPIDITTLLGGVLNPLAAPFLSKVSNGPQLAQNINTQSIFDNVLKFGIGKIAIGEFNNDVGSLNYDDPAMTVDVGLWLQTMFNMSINGLDIQLLDGGIYNALHLEGGFDFNEVAREASIAKVTYNNPGAVHFNSCIPYSQARYGKQVNDPMKPYVLNKSSAAYDDGDQRWVVDDGVIFELDRDSLNDNKPYYNREIGQDVDKLSFNNTGFNETNYLALETPTLNNLSISVQLFNKSHGNWEDRYARKYWKFLGGPYFPPQRYGKEYGGYPDHYMIYHKYYAPLVSLVEKAVKLLDENGIAADPDVISDLIQGIAIAGSINVTMFSMNLQIVIGPEINALIEPVAGLLLGLTGVAIKDYLAKVVNPFAERIAPKEALISNMMLSQDIGDIFGDLINLEVIPIEGKSVFHGITFPGALDRSDHTYNPHQRNIGGSESRIWDGTEQWVEDESGTYQTAASEAIYNEYLTDPEDIPGYTGSLDHPFFTGEGAYVPKENFYKDRYYEKFKVKCDNYFTSTGNKYNPYFETYYSTAHPMDGSVHYEAGSKIEDPTKWPLKYDYDRHGRIRTAAITFHIGLMLEIPLGILSANLDMYLEDPYVPCNYMPVAYLFVNSSVKLLEVEDVLQDTYVQNHFDDIYGEDGAYDALVAQYSATKDFGDDEDQANNYIMALCGAGVNGTRGPPLYGHQPTPEGMLDNPGWVAIFNLRFFEGIGSDQFFNVLVGSLLENYPLILQGLINISLLGYEFYNIFVPNDLAKLGEPTDFYKRCEDYLATQGTGGHLGLGIPTMNGTASGEYDQRPEYEDLFPHYLLIGDPIELKMALSLEKILPIDKLMDAIGDIASLLDHVTIGIGFIYIDLTIDLMELAGIWIFLHIDLDDIYVHVIINMENIVPLCLWITTLLLDVTLGDSISLSIPITIPIAAMDVKTQSDPRRDLTDPYDFRYNAYADFKLPNYLRGEVETTLDTGSLIGGLLAALIGGGGFDLLLNIGLDILIPAGLDKITHIDMGLDDLGAIGV